MKFIFIAIISVILISGFVIVNSKETIKPSDPVRIVEQYCELAEKGDYGKIASYTAPVPQEYFDVQLKSFQKSNKSAQTEDSSKKVYLSSDSSNRSDSSFLELINEDSPKLLNRDAAFIRKINNVRTKENEARVEVELGSRLSENYLSRLDFLLYRKDNEWKVFMIEHPPLVSAYGMPNQ